MDLKQRAVEIARREEMEAKVIFLYWVRL